MKSLFRFAIYLVVAAWSSAAFCGSYEDFFAAVAHDDGNTVAGLLARGFDPNSPDEKGQRALLITMRDGAPQVAAVLLADPQTRVDLPNPAGETALMLAALKGRADWAQRLVEHGAAVNRDGWTPLHYAACAPAAAVAAMLLDHGAHIDALSPNRSTPLMLAAMYGNEATVDLLLAHGADRHLRNEKGLDAADFARQAGREGLAARLAH